MQAWRGSALLLAVVSLVFAQPPEEPLRQAVAARPRDAAAHSQYGIFLLGQGRLTEAVNELRTASALSPRSADHTYNLALALLQTEQPGEALAVLDRGSFVGADHLALRGNVLNALERPAEAATALRRAAALDPANPDTLYDLALTLLKLDAAAEAQPLLAQGSRRFPRVAKIHAARGMVAYSQGQNAEAVRAYETAVRLEPGAADLHAALGDVRQATGDLRAAESAYRNALRLDASPAEVHVKLGRTLARRQRVEEAAVAFARAIQLDPANAEAHFELGKAALARGEHAAAVDQLRRAVESAPGLKGAWYQLGLAYKRAGEDQQSRAAMEQFRKLP